MELEKQVVSLDLAKKLKALGVRQESAFYWEQHIAPETDKYTLWQPKGFNNADAHRYFAAFTVAELGEMLLQNNVEMSSRKSGPNWSTVKVNWHRHSIFKDIKEFELEADTEADARAKMLVYLIEQGIVKPEGKRG